MTSTDKIALVTGAGTGIGRAAALGLLSAGWPASSRIRASTGASFSALRDR
jgi:NAD(P)-dependent dehydrogenase (short-subunit alcohol dehydrogenase family)